MRPPFQLKRTAFRDSTAVVNGKLLTIIIGLILGMLRLTSTMSQQMPFPQILNVASGPACAASANGTGHMICVVSANGALTAISEAPSDIQAAIGTFTLDATGPISTGTANPLPLTNNGTAINGTVGSSSCASVADSTGDTVCAYNSGGNLYAVRFSIFGITQTVVENLGTPIVGNASCATGAMRFDNQIPPAGHGIQGPFARAQEGTLGQTICAFRSTNNELWSVAFNPAEPNITGSPQDLGVVAVGDPSCIDSGDGNANVNQGATPAICAFRTASNLQGIAFDPRSAFRTPPQSLYVGTTFTGDPGCAIPNDASGQIICAISGPGDTLYGFAFNPRTPTNEPTLQSLDGAPVTGRPACAGLNDGTHRVICAVRSSANIVNTAKFDPRLAVVGFSTGVFSTGLFSTGAASAGVDLSCIFLNVHPFQVNCGGVLPSQSELFGVILHPLISPGPLAAAVSAALN
jgi:hypothetical protein